MLINLHNPSKNKLKDVKRQNFKSRLFQYLTLWNESKNFPEEENMQILRLDQIIRKQSNRQYDLDTKVDTLRAGKQNYYSEQVRTKRLKKSRPGKLLVCF